VSDNSPGPSRRTLAKGVAWAVPAVSIVAATPAHAVSSPTANALNLSSAWYSCNNGTFEFYFNPTSTITITAVTITSTWTPFTGGYTLALSTVSKDQVGATARFKASFQDPKVNNITHDSSTHFSAPLSGCALDVLKEDGSTLLVTYTQNSATKTATYSATEIYNALNNHFTMGNAQSCGICGGPSNTPATTFAAQSLAYDGKDGEWEITFTGGGVSDGAKITKVEMFTSACGNTTNPLVTWTGSSLTPKLTAGPNTALGTCGDSKQAWYGHFGDSSGTNTKCPGSVLVADSTYFRITHANGHVETLNAPAVGLGKYKYSSVKNLSPSGSIDCPA